MGFTRTWRRFWQKRARKREARRLLAALFSRPDLNRISSLRPEHRSRAVFLSYETEGEVVSRIRFGVVRHPKPIRVPGVHHEVIELYAYDVAAGTVAVESSHNVTKKGPPGEGTPP